jgi:hypothetical protein
MITDDVGRVIGDPFVKRAKLGRENLLYCPVRLSDGGDAEAVFYPGSGADIWPCKNDIVSVKRVGGFLVIDGIKPAGDPAHISGEIEFFGRTTAGERKSSLFMDGEGNIKMNGDGRWLVTWAELAAELDRLWGVLKSHTHPGVARGDSTTDPSPAISATDVDLSAAEAPTLRTGM